MRRILVILLALALLASACGDDGAGPTTSTSTSTTSTTTTTVAPTSSTTSTTSSTTTTTTPPVVCGENQFKFGWFCLDLGVVIPEFVYPTLDWLSAVFAAKLLEIYDIHGVIQLESGEIEFDEYIGRLDFGTHQITGERMVFEISLGFKDIELRVGHEPVSCETALDPKLSLVDNFLGAVSAGSVEGPPGREVFENLPVGEVYLFTIPLEAPEDEYGPEVLERFGGFVDFVAGNTVEQPVLTSAGVAAFTDRFFPVLCTGD